QVLQAATYLEAALPARRPRQGPHRHDVPTRLLDESTYPVGGFASLSTRGSMESLLQSQLAYMEKIDVIDPLTLPSPPPGGGEGNGYSLALSEEEGRVRAPDLFDAKYLRDELLYYSRDENEFLRRRRTFAFMLYP